MGTKILCCKCGEHFDERTLEGTWLKRRCPVCGKRLSENFHDAEARAVIAKLRRSRHDKADDTAERTDELERKLGELAFARYYTSEWFRLSCASRGSESSDRGLFGLSPSYDRVSKNFRLGPADPDRSPEMGLGASAEYFVFDALRAEITKKSSPLAGARLLPGLVFPWFPNKKPQQWGASVRAETDCVVLGESCAVVIEVKRHNHHVKASADSEHVRERSAEGASYKSANEILEQIENGAAAFEERQELYPHERIYRAVIFVEPLSFACKQTQFRNGVLVSCLDHENDGAHARFIEAFRQLFGNLEPIAEAQDVSSLAEHLMNKYGNTAAPNEGSIIQGQGPAFPTHMRTTAKMLEHIERLTADPQSPLFGARLLTNLSCTVQTGKRGKPRQEKQVGVAGLLLTRAHAILIDTRSWHVHVNTHVPFATVYTGNPKKGAKPVNDEIRHDWDLDPIHYENRSGSLTLFKFVAKRVEELAVYRDRNRVCSMNIFLNPASFHSDSGEFRQRTFIGYWSRKSNNIVAALEELTLNAEPIMSQEDLDAFAVEIASIGRASPGVGA